MLLAGAITALQGASEVVGARQRSHGPAASDEVGVE